MLLEEPKGKICTLWGVEVLMLLRPDISKTKFLLDSLFFINPLILRVSERGKKKFINLFLLFIPFPAKVYLPISLPHPSLYSHILHSTNTAGYDHNIITTITFTGGIYGYTLTFLLTL